MFIWHDFVPAHLWKEQVQVHAYGNPESQIHIIILSHILGKLVMLKFTCKDR